MRRPYAPPTASALGTRHPALDGTGGSRTAPTALRTQNLSLDRAEGQPPDEEPLDDPGQGDDR
jgi:hypothetical protein